MRASILMVCASLGAMLPSGSSASARLRLNELNLNITGGCDLVELRAVDCGSMNGVQLWDRVGPVLAFSGFSVQPEDLIVVHFNSASTTCNPGASGNETTSAIQFPSALYGRNFDTAYDWYSATPGLPSTSETLAVYDSSGAFLDAVLLSDGTSLPTAVTQSSADAIAAAGQWSPGSVTGTDFIANAVHDLNAVGTTMVGNSIQRLDDTDHNDAADWTTGSGSASTWGVRNAGQTAHFTCTASVLDGPAQPFRFEARPTISDRRAFFALDAPLNEPARLEIFDALGRPTALLWLLAGARSATWEGYRLSGARATPGTYFARLSTSQRSAVTRFVLVR